MLDVAFVGGDARNGVAGVVAYELSTGDVHVFACDAVLFATGGFGRMFKVSSNAHTLTGDGPAILWRRGVPLQDMEFFQFHPTGIHRLGILLSEAARGEGGILRNSEGELRIEAQSGLSPAFVRFFEGMSGPEYLQEDCQVFIPDVASDASLAGTGSGAVLKDAGIVAIACTPIVGDAGVPLGSTSAYYREPTTERAANLRGQQIVAVRVGQWLRLELVER